LHDECGTDRLARAASAPIPPEIYGLFDRFTSASKVNAGSGRKTCCETVAMNVGSIH